MPRLRQVQNLLPLLVLGCAPLAPPAPEPLAVAVEPAAGPAREWPAAGSCTELLAAILALEPPAARELDKLAAPLVIEAGAADGPPLVADLPLPVIGSAGIDPAGVDAAPCRLRVGAAEPLPTAADRVLERRVVQSAYPAGTRRQRNPAHQALERDLAVAKRAAGRGVDRLTTGDPLLDLIGLAAGGLIDALGAASANRETVALEEALAATPAHLETADLAPYRYDLVVLEAERGATVPVALDDRATGAVVEAVLTLHERRTFALGHGRHPQDSQPADTGAAVPASPAELAAWRRGQPQLTTRHLLTHLLAAANGGAPGHAATASPAAVERRPDQPMTSGLLRVGDGDAAGFYVTAEHIVAPASALGHSSLVAVRYPDGVAAYGLVELVDDTTGLALLYLPRPGAALPRAPGRRPPPFATATPPGVPWSDGDQVVGLFVTDRDTGAPRWIDASTLEPLLQRLDAL